MSAKKQGEAVVFKHRLAGAAVLIGFAVIVVPLLLGGPGPGDEQAVPEQGAESDQSDSRVFRSNITPIGGATPTSEEREEALQRNVSALMDEGGADDPAPQAGTDSAAERGAPPATPDEPAASTPAATDDDGGAGAAQPVEPEPAAEPRQVERGWIVQVGTFRKSSNAEKLMSDLKSSGFGPSTTDVETSAGPATRVWVGPFETRVEAARVKNRVAQKIGSEPLIVAYP